jgi:signal transduction histidine kinase
MSGMSGPIVMRSPQHGRLNSSGKPDGNYAEALRRNLTHVGQSDRGEAYVFGRTALNERRGLIDLVLLHHAALDAALPAGDGGAASGRRALLDAAGEFLAESLSPYEMAHRGFLEANAALVGLNGTLEREAKRIARLLHDGAGQLLFALQLSLADLNRQLPAHLGPLLDEIRSLTLQLDEQLHQHSRELYPVVLEDLGLVPALRQLLESLDKRSNILVEFKCTTRSRPPAHVEVCVYRCVQEALTNAMKHARATRITVRLWQTKTFLACSVTDNGIGGIPAEPVTGGKSGLGLVSIRERMKLVLGTVEIRSRVGAGSEVILTAPLIGDPAVTEGRNP